MKNLEEKLNMKTKQFVIFILTLFLVISGCSTVPAQGKMTDRELEGLKGSVKSVISETESLNLNGVSVSQSRQKKDEYYFNKEGRVVEIVIPDLNAKMVFSVIDGFKTYRNTKINEESQSNNKVIVVDQPEKPRNTISPENRYNFKFNYEYDTQGRVKIEEQFLNDGKLFQRTEYKYDDKGLLKEQIVDNTSDIATYSYKYDEKENLIEQLEDRKVKKYGVDREIKTIYTEYKIDSHRNWIQRTETSYIKEKGDSFIVKRVCYRTINYF